LLDGLVQLDLRGDSTCDVGFHAKGGAFEGVEDEIDEGVGGSNADKGITDARPFDCVIGFGYVVENRIAGSTLIPVSGVERFVEALEDGIDWLVDVSAGEEGMTSGIHEVEF
jgi:hypothetical protein